MLDNTILSEITWVVSVELLLLAAVNLGYNPWVRLGLAVRKLVDVSYTQISNSYLSSYLSSRILFAVSATSTLLSLVYLFSTVI